MSHDLEIVNGKASFAYNGKRGNPWHMLGTDVEGDMPLHVMLEAARADYTVSLQPVYVSTQIGTDDGGLPIFVNTEVEGHYATVREGGAQPEAMALGIVKGRYEVQQNADLAEVAQTIVGLGKGDACWDTMGVIRDGRVFFAYLRLPSLRVDPSGINDKINQGLVVATSHDGTMQNTIGFSSVRVVCQNTLSMALGGLTQKIGVKHTANAEDRIKAAAAGLSMYINAQQRMTAEAERMMQVKGSDALNAVLKKHWPAIVADDASKTAVTKRDNVRGTIVRLYQDGPNNRQVTGDNGWGVYNAAVEYLDWEATVRGTTDRFERIITSTTLEDTKRSIAKTVLDLVAA
jgi:phage/plasmid-like protein (TIGR03299 family)